MLTKLSCTSISHYTGQTCCVNVLPICMMLIAGANDVNGERQYVTPAKARQPEASRSLTEDQASNGDATKQPKPMGIEGNPSQACRNQPPKPPNLTRISRSDTNGHPPTLIHVSQLGQRIVRTSKASSFLSSCCQPIRCMGALSWILR